jgi:hypothetical protein
MTATTNVENDLFKKQDDRIRELFEPVHDKFTEEGIDPIGAIYSIVMDMVLRDVTMGVDEDQFDQVFNKHYDLTVDAIGEMIDKAYDLKDRIKAKRNA